MRIGFSAVKTRCEKSIVPKSMTFTFWNEELSNILPIPKDMEASAAHVVTGIATPARIMVITIAAIFFKRRIASSSCRSISEMLFYYKSSSSDYPILFSLFLSAIRIHLQAKKGCRIATAFFFIIGSMDLACAYCFSTNAAMASSMFFAIASTAACSQVFFSFSTAATAAVTAA